MKITITSILMYALAVLPVAGILYITMIGAGKPRQNTVFGVLVPVGELESTGIGEIVGRYRKEFRWFTLAAVLAGTCILFEWRYFGLYTIAYCIYIFGFCAVLMLPYIRANKRMKALKKAQGWQTGASGVVMIDTKVSAGKTPRKITLWHYLICMVIIAAGLLPYRTHGLDTELYPFLWNVGIGLGCFMSFVLVHMVVGRMPNRVYSTDSDINRKMNGERHHVFALLIWLSSLITSIILAATSFFLFGGISFFVYMSVNVVTLLALAVVVVVCYRKFRQIYSSAVLGEPTVADGQSEDDNWIWGMFYYNKNDSRFFVEAPYGMSMSFNLAKPAAIVIYAVAGLIVAGTIGLCAWTAAEEFTAPDYALDGTSLTVSTLMYSYNVDVGEAEVTLRYNELASGRKLNGFATEEIWRGRFNVSGYGNVDCILYKNPVYISVITPKMKLLVNLETEAETLELYQKIKNLSLGG